MQHITNANYSNQVIHGAYYPHIDGIRAFAVLPVVLFHILACLCPGGYAGVDVFFVISGYLITGGILRDLALGRFTIRDFYHRRIRRILPAYFAVVAGVFAFGCAVYHALPLMRLADATTMGTLFVANQYLWNVGGDYFSPDIHTNPLLHLWSLSVEEQFYLFIPVICLLVWKFRRRWLLPLLAALALGSLGWAMYAMASGRQVMAFYVLPLRAWELLAGSLLAMIPPFQPRANPSPARQQGDAARFVAPPPLLSGLGLLLIIVPYVLYSSATSFPGAAALPSVIGTALLIRYGAAGWVGGLLAWRPLVAVGKISYSLYLWHWPVIVYWKYMVYDQLGGWDYAGMFLLSLLLAWLAWKFVELPVRASPAWTMRRSFAFAAAGIVLLVSLGVTCVLCRGWPAMLHASANEMLAENDIKPQFVESLLHAKIKRIGRAFGCTTANNEPPVFFRKASENFALGAATQPDILLIGDSHACALQYGLDIVLREQGRAGRSTIRCGKIVFILGNDECHAVLETLAQFPQISMVVLAEHWHPLMKDPARYVLLEKFAAHIKGMGKTLFLVGDVPDYVSSPVDRMAKERIIGSRRLPSNDYARQSEKEYEQGQGETNRKLAAVCRATGAVFIPSHLALKNGDHYVTMMQERGKTTSLYRDTDHLSQSGSLCVARFVMPYLFSAPSRLGVPAN